MSGDEELAEANVLPAFALMIGGAPDAAVPTTIAIIWICA